MIYASILKGSLISLAVATTLIVVIMVNISKKKK